MTLALRCVAALLVLALAWPELARYRAEWTLATARSGIQAILASGDAARAAREAPAIVSSLEALPPEPRRDLLLGLALILARDAVGAGRVLDDAIARHERPELVLNLGRARAAAGDDAGARRAFLRSGWAAPAALATLPATVRTELLAEIARREQALAAGRSDVIPPLR